jgi:hypothetical protein
VAAPAFLDAVLADVNGVVTTASDVAIARAVSLFGLIPSDVPIRHDDVRRVVDARLIADEARRLQIVADPVEIDEAWRAAADRLGGVEVLRRWMDEAGLDEAWVRALVEAEVRRRRFIEVRFRAFAFVTEEEVAKAIEAGSPSPETRENARNALREAAVARELAAWLTEARARAAIRHTEIAPTGVPLPFPMPQAASR